MGNRAEEEVMLTGNIFGTVNNKKSSKIKTSSVLPGFQLSILSD